MSVDSFQRLVPQRTSQFAKLTLGAQFIVTIAVT